MFLSRVIERLGANWSVIGFDTFGGFPTHRSPLAMSTNINKKPALILQVARGGSTQQARKKYKLTDAGKKWVAAKLA